MRFILVLLCNLLANRFFLAWAQREADTAIGAMQDAAFDTPGAQSPLPASVLIGAGLLLSGEMALARGVWRLPGGQALLALLLGGVGAGIAHFATKRSQP